MRTRTLFLVMCVTLSACSMSAPQYVDAGGELRYQGLVPSDQQLSAELLILGIDSFPSTKRIEHYVIVPRPGIDGREVMSRAVLDAGTKVRVKGVQACKNCSGKSERFIVEVPGYDKNVPIYLYSSAFGYLTQERIRSNSN